MEELIKYINKFNEDRDWKQFHTPNNLAKSIVIEANELMEHFQFSPDNYDKDKVCDELADVITYCIDMADALNVDIKEIIYKKFKENEAKYPIELAKGSNLKYDKLRKD